MWVTLANKVIPNALHTIRGLKLLGQLGFLTPIFCHYCKKDIPKPIHWSQEKDEKNIDQSLVTLVILVKATQDLSMTSKILDR